MEQPNDWSPNLDPRDFEPEVLRPMILAIRPECFSELEHCAIERWNLSCDDPRLFSRTIISDIILPFKTANSALDSLGKGLIYEYLRLKCWSKKWTHCDHEGTKRWVILVCQREMIESFRIPKKQSSINTLRRWAEDFNTRQGITTSMTQQRTYMRGRGDEREDRNSELANACDGGQI